MSPSELANLFEQNPTQPYRLTLDSGDRVIVAEPRRTLTTETMLFFRAAEEVHKPLGQVKMISIFSISMVEPIDRAQLPARSRRRR